MTNIPAGWYDDPEDTAQRRYWNGETWTDDKAPKGPELERSQKPADIVKDGYQLAAENWKSLFVIGLLPLATLALIAIGVVVVVSVSDIGLNDEDFDPSAGFVLAMVVAGVIYAVSLLLALGSWNVHLAAARAGQPKTAGESLELGFRRLPRWLGRGLLWILVTTVLVVVFGLLASITGPALLLLSVPAMIFIWPYGHLAIVAFFVSPDDVPPIRSVISLLDGKWRPIALRSLLVCSVLLGCWIVAAVIELIPILGLLVGLPLTFFLGMFQTGMNVSLYGWASGPVANDIVKPPPAGATPS